jgi:hypothetical protein
MARRWKFEEDYIVCRFSYEYLCRYVSRKELDLLILELKERGFTGRSIDAINRRVRDYQEVFVGRPDYLATEQVKAIAIAYMNRMENSGRLKELQLCIDNMLQHNDECWFDNEAIFTSDTQSLHHLVDLDPSAPSFKELVLSHMRKKKLTETEVYKGSFVSRYTFSHIINGRKGKNVKPDNGNKANVSQRTAMQLCIGLKLTYEEAVYFMSCAGHAFKPNEDVDRVVVACLKNGICNIYDINEELYERKFPVFESPCW